MPLAREPPKKERIYPIYVSRSGLKRYIRWESTPAGLQRCTEEVCHALYARISQQECRGILEGKDFKLIAYLLRVSIQIHPSGFQYRHQHRNKIQQEYHQQFPRAEIYNNEYFLHEVQSLP